MVRRLPVHNLDPESGADGQIPILSGGKFVIGDPDTSSIISGDDGRTHRLGLDLTKQGIVIAKGAGGTWDADMVESPSVMYDPKSGKWAMVYSGYGTTSGAQRAGVGLAYSTDGVTWSKYGSAAILPHSGTGGAPDQNGCSGPVLFWDNDNAQYVLYYIGLTSTGYEAGTKTICYATATSLTGTWTRHGAAISTSGAGWRGGAVWHVSIVKRDLTWYCFFNASTTLGVETIGYATASSITGPWTVDDANSPILSNTGTGWESHHIGDPSVRRVGDMWVMDYYGYDDSPDSASDGIAVCPDSAFPLGPWVRYSGNPVLLPSESYDAKYAHKPFVIYKGGILFHYYTAVAADATRQIALATEGLVEAPAPLALTIEQDGVEVATDVDTLNFEGDSVDVEDDGAGHVTITITVASGGSSGELLMQDGVTAPPVPIETEAQDDWLYQD